MKTTIHQLTHVLSLYLNFKSTLYTIISWILIIALLNMFSGCMYYFKVKTILPPTPKDFAHIENLNKNIIIHMDDEAWELALPSLKEDSLEGYIIKKYVSTYNKPVKTKGSNRYKNRIEDNETYLLNEVHLYITEMTVFNGSKILIPLSKIERMELYEKDEAATVGSWTLGIISGTSAAAFLLIIIALATKESCPFIYTFNGNSYQFTGEIYSGSVQPRLERDDYLKLPLYDINNPEYKLKISNEVKEIQHTNLMELWVIDHDKNIDIWLDKYGNLHSVKKIISPSSVLSNSGIDATYLIKRKDSLFYSSPLKQGDLPVTDALVMEFPYQGNSDSAKLLISARNSFLLDYMMGVFQNQFGNYYNKWTKKQQRAPTPQLIGWSLDQNIPLSLYVERSGKWDRVDYFNIAGPMAMKDDILQFPLTGAESNPLKIKLEFGNMFWEIDYAGMDYSTDFRLNHITIPITSANNQKGKDVSSYLQKDDKRYYIQSEIGDNAEVAFNLPPCNNESRTIYLHTKGWYQVIHNPKGKPNIEYLKTFREPGRFNRFVNEYVQSIAYANKEKEKSQH